MQAEQTFRPPVQSVRLLYCYQLLSLRHSPFAPRLFPESTEDMILQVLQQNNPSNAACHSNAAGAIVRGVGGGDVTPRLHADIYQQEMACARVSLPAEIFADTACQKKKLIVSSF